MNRELKKIGTGYYLNMTKDLRELLDLEKMIVEIKVYGDELRISKVKENTKDD